MTFPNSVETTKVRVHDSFSKYVAIYSYFSCHGISQLTAGALG